MNNLHKKKDVYELTRLNNLFTRNEINIPGFDDYRVLKCDFHTHTVFSDGLVWPDGRIYEAWQDGLDAIAITDHIEHRINQDLLNGDLNQSYKIAKTAADDMELIVIPGVEITRDKPLGHFNALFIQDANLIEKKIHWIPLLKLKNKERSLYGIILDGRIIMSHYIRYMNN